MADLLSSVGFMFFIGFVGGWITHMLLIRHLINQFNKNLEVTINDDNFIDVDVERYNGFLLFYQSNGKKFICQVPSIHEFVLRFHSLFPGKLARIKGAEENLLDELVEEIKLSQVNE